MVFAEEKPAVNAPASNTATAKVATSVAEWNQEAQAFIDRHLKEVRPLEVEAARAWWDANTTGTDEAYQKKVELETKFDALLADPQRFAELKQLESTAQGEGVVRRQIHLLYLQYMGKQVDPQLLARMTSLANTIEQKFNVYRAKVGSEELTDSQVREILKKSTDSERRKAVWEASKAVGPAIETDIRELVRLRNEAAERLGFRSYHAMMLALNEQDPQEVLRLFDELDALTREPFQNAKRAIDESLAKKYGVSVAELRPWHYQDPFFQEAPDTQGADLDRVFANVDIAQVCRNSIVASACPWMKCWLAAISTKSPAKARMLFAPISIAKAMSVCSAT